LVNIEKWAPAPQCTGKPGRCLSSNGNRSVRVFYLPDTERRSHKYKDRPSPTMTVAGSRGAKKPGNRVDLRAADSPGQARLEGSPRLGRPQRLIAAGRDGLRANGDRNPCLPFLILREISVRIYREKYAYKHY